MPSSTDEQLTLIYKNMFGLSNIESSGNSTVFLIDTRVVSNLNILNNAYFDNNLIAVNLHVSSNCSVVNSTINSILHCNSCYTHSITNYSDMMVYGSLNVNTITTGSIIVADAATISSSIYVSDTATIHGNVTVAGSYLYSNSDTIQIYGDKINIGHDNSIIKIISTNTSNIVNELNIENKIIVLNSDFNGVAQDEGYYSGFEIYGTGGNGYIKVTDDGMRYMIKSPANNYFEYIGTIDGSDENLIIKGGTILHNTSILHSYLNISSNAIFSKNLTILNELHANSTSVLNGSITILSNLNILGSCILNNMNISNNTCIGNNVTINNSCTMQSDIYVSGNTLINKDTTLLSSLIVNNITEINNPVTVNSFLVVGGTTNVGDNLNVLSRLNVNGDLVMSGNCTVSGSLIINGTSLFSNKVTINSTMLVSGNSILSKNVTVNSNITLYGQVINQMDEYLTNESAKNNGVPIGGLYRTGGIVKIRLNDA